MESNRTSIDITFLGPSCRLFMFDNCGRPQCEPVQLHYILDATTTATRRENDEEESYLDLFRVFTKRRAFLQPGGSVSMRRPVSTQLPV